jgi:hypothetical protein
MSQRHRSDVVAPLPRQELRAHAHAERHRIHSELHLLSTAVGTVVEIDEADEPGVGFKPVHHHDADRARAKVRGEGKTRHWKRKEWKRRTALRRARAVALRAVGT